MASAAIELYAYGILTEMGGAPEAHICIDRQGQMPLTVRATREQLEVLECNLLYRPVCARVSAVRDLATGTLLPECTQLLSLSPHVPDRTLQRLHGLTALATPSLTSKSADWLHFVRGINASPKEITHHQREQS